MERNFDLERILTIANAGVKKVLENEDVRLDTFAIVGIFTFKGEDGQEYESVGVWSETRKRWAQIGILQAGLTRLNDDAIIYSEEVQDEEIEE
jgi:hypothetical protein